MDVTDGVLRMPALESSLVGLRVELVDLLVLDDFFGPWDCFGVGLLLIDVRLPCSGKD